MKESFKTKKGSTIRMRILAVCIMLLCGGMSSWAQKTQISGVITDESGTTLPGVTVIVANTTTGTTTDIDGKYTISANSTDVLTFSFLGMVTQRITVGTQSVINIVLKDEAFTLGETVVIGYGRAKKRDLTGSIASLKGSDIINKPSANPLASIQGKVAGVQVVNTGRAGQDPEIRIRGTNSINGYTPLYVVDGLFSDNISYLNPSDIESMEILKDPSSLAIFGVRGANGVIFISTKRAREGQTIVNINSSIGWKSINDKIDVTNASQFKELYNEQLMNKKADPFDYTDWQGNTNWQDQTFQTGFMTNNNASISGATGKNKFYMGVGYTTEEGSMISEKYSKLTLNLSSDYAVTNSLRFGFQVNGARILPPDAKNVGSSVVAAPIAPISDAESGLFYILPTFQSAQVRNPMIDVVTQGAHNLANNYRGAGNVYGEIDFLKHFNFKATFSLDFRSEESRQYTPIITVYNPAIDGPENLTQDERVNQMKLTSLAAQTDYILTYTNKFGDHGITGTAGLTTNYTSFSKIEAGRSQNINDIIFSIPNDNPDKWWITSIPTKSITNNGEQYNSYLMSLLARGLYNYKNRYLLNISYRRDGSSVFYGEGNTWDNFYSFGGGWIISEESFMQDQEVINFLKLKGSWGILGSQNIGGNINTRYPTYPQKISTGSVVFGDNSIGTFGTEYKYQNLGWEKTNSMEVGFELNMINNRLRIEPTYYNKKTDDIIVLLDGQGGVKNSLENLGDLQNKGIELTGSWSDKIGDSGFNYSLGANLTTIDNKVLSLGRNEDDAIYAGTKDVARSISGYPVGYFYGYKVIGVYQNKEDIKQSPINTLASAMPGDLKFADVSGPDGIPDGKIDNKDRTMIGNPTPDFTYGFNVNLSYKNFDLGVDMMGVYGNEIYRTWDASTFAQLNYLTQRMDRWHGEGTSNWQPILDPDRSLNQLNSSYYIEDGSFFRIRNVQLGYTFSPQLLKKACIKSLRIYGNIQNLKTWSKNTGYTPEIGGTAIASGIDNGTYPMPAIYTLGLNLTF